MKVFVDANVFIRLFSADDEAQCEAAERLFQEAKAGGRKLVTGPPVFFETSWVLGYRYKLSSAEVLDVLSAMLAFPDLHVVDETLVLKAITRARATDSEFADAYIAISAEEVGAEAVATFNKKHFKKLRARIYEGL